MRQLAVIVALVTACSRAPETRGPEMATVNAVVGDASFVVAHGRAPTATDSAQERIRTHLAFAEGQLRASEPLGLTADQRIARTRALDHLHAYWEHGVFPASDAKAGWLPTFVDDRGVRCAVAYLAEQDLGTAPIAAINAHYRNAYIAQIDDAALVAWADTAGFSRQELALIQPAYPPRGPDIQMSLMAEYTNATGEDTARGELTHGGGLRGGIRWSAPDNHFLGSPLVSVSGAVGYLGGDDRHLTYDAHAAVGLHVPVRGGLRIDPGFTIGFGVDGVTDRTNLAFTIPVDGFLMMGRGRIRVGVLGGPRFSPDDRTLGWRAGLAFVRRSPDSPFGDKRDLRFELGAERIDDAVFIGLRVGITTRSLDEWWDRS